MEGRGMVTFLLTVMAFMASAKMASSEVASSSTPLEFGGSDEICSHCDCQGFRVVCSKLDGRDVTFVDVSATVTVLEVRNAGIVTFRRGSFRVGGRRSRIVVADSRGLQLNSMCITMLEEEERPAKVLLEVASVGRVSVETRSVNAKAGNFRARMEYVGEVSLAGQAFDVLKSFAIERATSLVADPAAFKPRVIGEIPDLEVVLRQVESVVSLPAGVFTSSKSIVVENSRVKEIAANAFSGYQMISVQFHNTSIDRIHRGAFPDRTYIDRLTFSNCTITSMSERAVQSGISQLSIRGTRVDSISRQAVRSNVATATIQDNVFKTLKNRSLVLQSWDKFLMSGNQIDFMDSDCLAGVSGPNDGSNIAFSFVDNRISYANRDALRMNMSARVLLNLSGNVFEEECSCESERWLDMVCGSFQQGDGDRRQGLDASGLLRNHSFCKLKSSARECFDDDLHVKFVEYYGVMCVQDLSRDAAAGSNKCSEPSRLQEMWEVVQEQIDIDTNKGILTVILLFALVFSLLVSICTLLRWIVFTINERSRYKNEDEWNFTKIEERRMMEEECQTPSPTDHYESLPLTKEEDVGEEEEEVGSIQTSRSDVEKTVEVHSGDGGAKDHATVNSRSPSTTSPARASSSGAEKESSGALSDREREQELSSEGIGRPPKMTFYDEMIDLLKEKLEDPDNYATVVDSSAAASAATAVRGQSLYQDPFDIGSPNRRGGAPKK